jgi:type VI secretion system protein ImpC
MKGTIKWNKSVTVSINKAIKAIDAAVSKQLAAVMHNAKFQQLEGSWRGLNYLVMNSETGASLKIRVMNVSKQALFKDLDKAVELDQSQIFKKIYENEFGPHGEPAALIGDYRSGHRTTPSCSRMSNVAARRSPFLGPGIFDKSFESKPRDLEKIFDSTRVEELPRSETPLVALTMPASRASSVRRR